MHSCVSCSSNSEAMPLIGPRNRSGDSGSFVAEFTFCPPPPNHSPSRNLSLQIFASVLTCIPARKRHSTPCKTDIYSSSFNVFEIICSGTLRCVWRKWSVRKLVNLVFERFRSVISGSLQYPQFLFFCFLFFIITDRLIRISVIIPNFQFLRKKRKMLVYLKIVLSDWAKFSSRIKLQIVIYNLVINVNLRMCRYYIREF